MTRRSPQPGGRLDAPDTINRTQRMCIEVLLRKGAAFEEETCDVT